MKEIIKVKNASYERYEELLIQKDTLKKEAEEYRLRFNKEFGELCIRVLEEKMNCIEKRKTISYCKNMILIGGEIYKSQLDKYINETMTKYKEALDMLKENTKKAKSRKDVSDSELKEIKNKYYKIAKLIHPDMNSDLRNDSTILDLWNRTSVAYECLELKELTEIEIMVNSYLESINHTHEDIVIPDVQEKIFDLNEEIKEILNTNPYQYKYILASKKAMANKRKELKKELKDYIGYKKELQKQIKEFKIINK